ncbi:LamG-like jellyroll fold domain-containing protein [Catellatospora chokoriensis]|uniref:F5/8 type C domain-containing protein n=1 Tax=Catellatospora chokoriensis TaxID=310353 RepID=A0A8J3NSF4_9ACTN|nr:LamG-like jellyroll fold domain-containing protein [Catellatospora chokoriensis]GIF90491.1 hypothetical protein Cch02nite_39350 [Catellatospora chokoriensis]
MGRSAVRVLHRVAFVTAVLFGLTFAVPAGVVPANGEFPISWLWSWLPHQPAWAGDALFSLSGHELNGASGRSHDAPSSATRANGGAGRAPGHAPGALPDDVLPEQTRKPTTTPPIDGKFDPATSKRLPQRSGRSSDVYQNADGTMTRRVAAGPVNFRASDGTWQPIKTGLQRRSDGRLHMTANSLAVSLAGRVRGGRDAGTALVSMTLPGGQKLGYDLADAADVTPVVDGSLATYRGVLPQTDLELRMFESGVEETMVLASPDAPNSWLYPLHLDGLTPRLDDDGYVALLDTSGKTVAWFPRGRMEDSHVELPTGERTSSDKITYELVDTPEGQALRVTADAAWLRDPARVYPVRVDPTATTGTTADVFVDNDPSTDSSTQNGHSLAVGYDNESPARSFIAFDEFDDDSFLGKRITSARLKLFHTWSWNCTAHLPVYVHKVLDTWKVVNLSTSTLPGPSRSNAIGTLNITDNYPACTNTSANRDVGKDWWVSLNPGTFNDWSIGGRNYGLALTASETDPAGWKRFTAANYNAGEHKAILELTYALNVAPQVDAQYPPHGYQSPTLTPELLVSGQDPDAFPKTITFNFQVFDKTGTKIAESGATSSRRWVVPSGKLAWGETYTWWAVASDGQVDSSSQTLNVLSTPVPQPSITSTLSQNGDKGFDPTAGNYTTAATDATIATVGPSLSVQRSYNSVDPRNSAFGFGWAGIADSRAVERYDAAGALQTVVVTYPNGQDVAFGKNDVGGSFTPPSGRFATFKSATGGGYELVDKDGTRYAYTKGSAGTYAISSISDAQGRTETFTYDANNRLAKMIAASGRRLHFTWAQPSGATAHHVTTVSTDWADPADANSVQTWQYNYTGDKLTSVCPPDGSAYCTTYTYENNSVHRGVVLNQGPRSYWRLNETSGTTANSSVVDKAGVDNGTYTDVALNQAGPLSGGTSKAVGFNGTSSSVKLPSNLAATAGYQSVSMWFKAAPGSGDGVLLSQSWDDPAASATSNGAYSPTLYLGSDGRLQGGYPTAPPVGLLGSMTSTASGRCLDVQGGPAVNYARLTIFDCHGGANQQWTLDSTNRLTVTVSGVTKCLDALSGGTADGTDVILFDCHTGTNQKWSVLADGRIMNQNSGKCLDVEANGLENGSYAQLWSCGTVPQGNQSWHSRAHWPMQTATSYADGNWHHVVLSAFGDQQKLFVDGQETGSKNGLLVQDIQDKFTYLGVGYLGGAWPNQSHPDVLKNTGTRDYFNGSIAEVSFFDRALTADTAREIFDARRSTDLLKSVVRPSGKVAASVNYDTVTGMVKDVTDENGGVWKLNAPTIQGTSLVYQSAALAGAPADYYRMAETGVTNAVNQVNGNTATYNSVTLGTVDGPFSDSTVASFNGTSSYLQLPAEDVPTAGPVSMSMWFKMPAGNTAGGVLYSYQAAPMSNLDAAGHWTPALYVGTDGKLRGQIWIESMTMMTSDNAVNDGKWHHVAISAASNSQALYLDGAKIGTLNSAIVATSAVQAYVGAGKWEGGWPAHGTSRAGYWPGQIADFAYYRTQLSDAQVASQFAARDQANGVKGKWVTITDPGDKSLVTISDLNTGRKVADTDARGKMTRYGYDTAGFVRTVTDPNGNVTITEHDVRGNTISSTTCQDYSASKCSTVYYTFYPDATTRVLTPDPRNDVMLTMRDGRSSSATDNTFLTTYEYDAKGNRTRVTDPLGRVTTTAYTAAPTATGSASCDANTEVGKAFDRDWSSGNWSKFCSHEASAWLQAQWPTAQTFTAITVRHAEAGGETAAYNTRDFDILTSDDGASWTARFQVRGNTSAVTTHDLPAPVSARYLKISVITPQSGAEHVATRIYEVETNFTVPAGLPRTVTTPGGAVQTVEYLISGDVAKVTDPAGLVTKYTYDQLGRKITETEVNKSFPAGVTTSYTYDKGNRIRTQTDPAITNRVTGAQHTAVTTTEYDRDGNVLSQTTADSTGGDASRTQASTYNNRGQQLTSTDEAGKTTTFEYDAFGRVVKEIEQDGGETVSTYDETGNLLTTTVKGFTGDPANPLPAPIDLVMTSKAYDPSGRLASETDPEGVTTEYTYTDNGLTATVTRKKGTSSFTIEQNTYDAAGNLIQQVTNNGATTTAYKYDAASRQYESTLDPGGLNRTTTQALSADDHVLATTDKDGTGKVYGYNESIYDPMGRVLASTTYSPTGLAPVARWRLDQTSGTTATDSVGNTAAQFSPTGVRWSTDRPPTRPDLTGSAEFKHDGTPGSLSTTGPVVDTARSYTVSAWVRLVDPTWNQAAVSQDGPQFTSFALGYDIGNSGWRMFACNADMSACVAPSSTSPAARDTWTHLTGVYDAGTKTVSLYVNGVFQGSQNLPGVTGLSGPLAIGDLKWDNARNDHWPGKIADVQAYQKALNAAEVASIYGGTAPAVDAKVIRTSSQLDVDGAVKAVADANGNTTRYEVDEAGRMVKSTTPQVLTESVDQGQVAANAVSWAGYDTFGAVTDSQDALGRWTRTEYDAAGHVVKVRMPSYTPPGSSTPITPETTSTYDDLGQLKTVTDPLGKVTSYDYDQLGRVWRMTAPDGGVTKYTYNNVGAVLAVTDPEGAVNETVYDFLGRTDKSRQFVRQTGQTHETKYTYGTGGWLSEVTSAAGVKTSKTYNAAGQPLTVKDGANNTTSYSYDGGGRLEQTTLADGSYTRSVYDLTDRVTSTSSYKLGGALLKTESSEYDPNGQVLSSTDAMNIRTTFTYDATGLLTSFSQPISGSDSIVSSFGYDLAGNRTRFTDGRNNSFWTAYNTLGLPERVIEPATTAFANLGDRTYTTAYDAAGRAVSQTQPGGVTTTYTYDDMGRLVAQSGVGAEATTADRTFGYDRAGRMVSLSGSGGANTLTYDDRGLLRAVTGPSGDSSFDYTADGNMAKRTDAAGETTYGYDSAGRLASLSNPAAGVLAGYEYNNLSQVNKITYGATGNVRSFGFDDMHRPSSDELKTPGTGGTTIAKIEYEFDKNGNETRKKTTGFAQSADNIYTYDLAGRLTSWNNGTATTVYAYDKSGNRVQNGPKTFTYDARNRLQLGGGATYTYTARGTLAQVTDGSSSYTTLSDAFGMAVSQQGTGGTQTYTYDGLGRAIRPGFAYTGIGNDLAADGAATYVRDTAGALVGEVAGAIKRLAYTDLHTDVVGQFTATGTVLDGSTAYDPLGKVLNTIAMIGNLGYQSEWTDGLTSRVNMHARWYNPDTGQFDSRDTASNSQVPDSINANRYQYGDGNPMTVTDPTGHWGYNPFKAIAKAASSVSSFVSNTVSSVRSSAASAWNSVSSYAAEKYQQARNYVATKVEQVKTVVKKAKNYVKKKVEQGRKWVAKKVDQVKKKAKAAYKKVQQAGKQLVAKAAKVATNPIGAIKDAYKATEKWVKENKNLLIEIAAVGVGVLAGLACTAVTAGAGAVACMVGAGALINLAKDGLQGDIHSLGDALGSLGTGALSGLAGGVGGLVGAKVAAAIANKVGTGVLGKLTTEAGENFVGDAVDQFISTGSVSPSSLLESAVPGLGALSKGPKPKVGQGAGGGGAGAGGGGPGGGAKSCHSFDPATPVRMADGSTRPIKDVNVGDKVAATDPITGETAARPVTMLHRNHDKDLTDVTVRNKETGKLTTLHTTQHHPFWNKTKGEWTDAKDLTAGTELQVLGAGEVVVEAVKSWDGEKEMRDLTVAEIHTYYVLAGDQPVLVHNNNANKYLEGCPVNVTSRTVTNSAGQQVERHTVDNEDDLLAIADHLAGGSLDNFENRKPDFWRGQLPDGTHRDIEFNLVGHDFPPEGPHVKLSELDDNARGVTKGNPWRTVLKVFIRGREFK